MVYRALGLMSGSSLDGLDIVFCEILESSGKWDYEILAASCTPYSQNWVTKLQAATSLTGIEYVELNAAYGKLTGEMVNAFIDQNSIHHQIAFIGSHGHTVFHDPSKGFTAQIGDGAAIAATTQLNVVSDLRALDIALGGQGAPIVPVGEQLLFSKHSCFLNIGGIANISMHTANGIVAYDICPANRVLNALCNKINLDYDDGGKLAATGFVRDEVLAKLNALPYYRLPFPKSLDNGFGLETVLPILEQANLSIADALRTMVEHVAIQISRNLLKLDNTHEQIIDHKTMLITGGGAFNTYLVERISAMIKVGGWQVEVPDSKVVMYKEALIMALLAVLRWREEATSYPNITGGTRPAVGGALWIGQAP